MISISNEFEEKNVDLLSGDSIEQKIKEYQEFLKEKEEAEQTPVPPIDDDKTPEPDDGTEVPGESEIDDNKVNETKGNGCGGNIVGTVIACLTLSGGVFFLRKKRKDS